MRQQVHKTLQKLYTHLTPFVLSTAAAVMNLPSYREVASGGQPVHEAIADHRNDH